MCHVLSTGDDGEADAYDPEIPPQCRENPQHEIPQTEVGPILRTLNYDMKLTYVHRIYIQYNYFYMYIEMFIHMYIDVYI